MNKPGRNDPCPCGSGKKYKKCCMKDEKIDVSLPRELLTGTPVDEYLTLFHGMTLFANGFMQFEKEGKVLQRKTKELEKSLQPGEPEGIPDSLFISWLYLDYRFGESNETICERFLVSYLDKLNDPASYHLKTMKDSYCFFYQIKLVSDDSMIFEELLTGKNWKVHRLNEPYEKQTKAGDIWYLRLLGNQDSAYIYTPPYIYEPEAKKDIENVLNKQKNICLSSLSKSNLTESDDFREFCKTITKIWMEKFADDSDIFSEQDKPVLHTTDGELLEFHKSYFRIIKKEGFREKLTAVKNFDYDSYNNTWIWYKKGNKRIKSFNTTILGTLYIQDDYLIAETNSYQRALKLRNKLEHGFKIYIIFDRLETQDLSSVQDLSEEEIIKLEKDKEELYKNPEVKKLLKDMLEGYYFNDWLKQKIPFLGNKTPLQAVKTEQGKKAVEKLLQDIQKMHGKEDYDKFDIDKLREKLGLFTHS